MKENKITAIVKWHWQRKIMIVAFKANWWRVNAEDASFVEKYEGERKIFYIPEEENQSLLLTLLFDTDSYTMPIAAEYRRGNVENDMGCVRLSLLDNATTSTAVHST